MTDRVTRIESARSAKEREIQVAALEDARRYAWPPVWLDDATGAQYRFLLRACLDEIDGYRRALVAHHGRPGIGSSDERR